MKTTEQNYGFETRSRIGAQFNGVQYARKRNTDVWNTSVNFSASQIIMNPIAKEEIPLEVFELIQEMKDRQDVDRQQREIRNESFAKKIEQERTKNSQILQTLIATGPIPTTLENLSLVLNFLNEQNWGTWNLPAMSIAYSANQYDCDGSTATTITLDVPILVDGEKIKKFKTGGRRGHLDKYYSVR